MNEIEILTAINLEIQNPLYWTKEEQNEAIDLAISALEKQIAKPCTYCQEKDVTIFYNDLLTVKMDCDNELEIEFQDGRETKIEWIKIECCPKCGRSLDWSVEE